MKYVLDSSVALKWVLPEHDSAIAIQLQTEANSGLHQFFAPDIYPVEIGNALTRAERKGIIPIGDADLHLLKILTTPPTLFDALLLLRRAMDISSHFRVALYDSLYVVTAERIGCEFVTADDRLVMNLQADFPFVISLSSLP